MSIVRQEAASTEVAGMSWKIGDQLIAINLRISGFLKFKDAHLRYCGHLNQDEGSVTRL